MITWVTAGTHDVPNLDAVVQRHKGIEVHARSGNIGHDLDLLPICLQVIEDQLALHPLVVYPACSK